MDFKNVEARFNQLAADAGPVGDRECALLLAGSLLHPKDTDAIRYFHDGKKTDDVLAKLPGRMAAESKDPRWIAAVQYLVSRGAKVDDAVEELVANFDAQMSPTGPFPPAPPSAPPTPPDAAPR